MNKLSTAERAQIIRTLAEGNSLRATVRLTGFAMNTILKLLRELGVACLAYQDRVLRYLPCQRIQADEIWSFVYAKAKNVPEGKRDAFGLRRTSTGSAPCSRRSSGSARPSSTPSPPMK